MPAQSLRRLFDRSDQINQNSRGVSVPPRGAGQTVQKAISLQCRKIRQPDPEGSRSAHFVSLLSTQNIPGSGDRLLNQQEMVEPDGIEPTTSCLQSRRSPS